MKKIIVLIVSFLFLAFPASVSAAEKEIMLGKDQIHQGDYFAAAEKVIISGTVNGDLYAGAGEVLIDGTVNGDALVGGGMIKILGTIEQDLRAGGGEVTLNGTIGRNASIGSGNLTFSSESIIYGNLVLGTGNANISGNLDGDLTVGTGQLTISGPIKGNVKAGAGNITLTDKAIINGDLTYWSESDATIATGSSILGETIKKQPPQQFSKEVDKLKSKAPKMKLGTSLIGLFSHLLVGLLIIALFPKLPSNLNKIIDQKPWESLGWGLMILFFTPIVAILLLITVIGIPLGFLAILAYATIIFLSKTVVAFWLGSTLAKHINKKLSAGWQLVIGLSVLYLLLLVPVIKIFTKVATLLLGTGTASLAIKKSLQSSKKK